MAKTILLVDDDVAVRTAIRRILERSGFTVVAAFDGQDALDKLAASEQKFDLIVSDLVMPRVDGIELMAQLKQRYPDVPALYISAYTGKPGRDRVIVDSTVPVLNKPFTLPELNETIGQLLQ